MENSPEPESQILQNANRKLGIEIVSFENEPLMDGYLPGIACDRFNVSDKSSTFFLTHLHTDHTVGLGSSEFANYLQRNDFKLYCSVGTSAYVSRMYPQLIPQTIALELEKPTTIVVIPPSTPASWMYRKPSDRLDQPYQVTVTTVSANHCHGSVQFLFERYDHKYDEVWRALYAGDARMDDAWFTDLRNQDRPQLYNAFHERNGTVKKFHAVYLDAMFIRQPTLPSRAESMETIIDIIERHQENYTLVLSLRAKFDSEDMMSEIYRRTGLKVHVEQDVYDVYAEDRNLGNCIIDDPWAKVIAFFNASMLPNAEVEYVYQLRCPDIKHRNEFEKPRMYERLCRQLNRPGTGVLVIRPTTLHFTLNGAWDDSEGIVQNYANVSGEGNVGLRVLRSVHSSCSEMHRLVEYLKPSVVRLMDIPKDCPLSEARRLLSVSSDESPMNEIPLSE